MVDEKSLEILSLEANIESNATFNVLTAAEFQTTRKLLVYKFSKRHRMSGFWGSRGYFFRGHLLKKSKHHVSRLDSLRTPRSLDHPLTKA
jgi:hypothetical protein